MARFTDAGPSLDTIVGLLERRRQAQGVVIEQMRQIKNAYNGDIVIPLPELDASELPAVPNLILNGLDQSSQRIASVMPNVYYPPVSPGSRRSEARARTRRLANLAWWDESDLPIKMYRRSRHLIGYGCTPVVIWPDNKKGIPAWHVRDPLSAFPCPTPDMDDMCPPDAIFTFRRPWAWLRDQYPAEVATLRTGYRSNYDVPSHMMFDVVEYLDGEVKVLAVLGSKPDAAYDHFGYAPLGDAVVELDRLPNRAGMCPVVFPGRVTLERRHGQFDGMIGMYQAQARLMALESIAVERGIFPDVYLESRPGETAAFVDGPYDGRTGQVNVIKGGQIRDVQINPGFMTAPLVDRLERAQRITAGIPAEFGGESPSNVRTGRRGEQIISAVVSFPTQEAQMILSRSLRQENKRAVAVAKNYFGNQPRSFYVAFGDRHVRADYVAERDFEMDANTVTYAQAGADINGLTVAIGQRIGLGTMSKETAMDMDPFVTDPETERGKVAGEALETALMASLQAQAQQGAIPPGDMARITHLVTYEQYTLADAVEKAQKEAQERQASSGPPGTPTGPVPPESPEAQPGLAAPGVGAEQPPIQPPPQGVENVSQLLAMLSGGA